MKETVEQAYPVEEEINLISLLAGLWRRRLLIIAGTLLIFLLGLVYALSLPRRYLSEAVLNLGSLAPAAYKKQVERLREGGRLLALARWSGEFSTEEIARLESRLSDGQFLQQALTPVTAFSAEQLRQLPIAARGDETLAVIGLRLNWSAEEAGQAARMVGLLARHARNVVLYEQVYSYLVTGENEARQAIDNLESQLINTRFSLERQKNRLSDLERISRAYPEAVRLGSTQMLNIQDGSERFLPLVLQKVGLEVAISSQQQKLLDLQFEMAKADLREAFFSRAYQRLADLPELGEPLLDMVREVHAEIFAGQDQSLDQVKLVGNQIGRQIKSFAFTFQEGRRLLSGPTLPPAPYQPSRRKIVMLAGLLGFMLMLILALAINWWGRYGRAVTGRSGREK